MNNKTVDQIREDVNEYLTSIGPGELPSETQIEEFADEFVAAHKREIAQLKACRDGDCDRFRLGAEPCPGCHIQTAIDKIDSLQSLVKVLADTLQKHLRCSGDCEGCMLTKLKYECKTKSDYELVRKAREVLNG